MKRSYVKVVLAVTTLSVLIAYQGCGEGFQAALPGSESQGSHSYVTPTCTTEAPFEKTLPHRLTKIEYNNVIRDLFGLNGDFSASFSNDPMGNSGFVTDSNAQNVSPEIIGDYWTASKAVADELFSKDPNPFLTCSSGDDCARSLISELTKRAFRRPPTPEEVDHLFGLYKEVSNSDFSERMKVVVRTVLMSPQFIFRTFEVPAVNSTAPVPLNDYELATRLSFFIWGSIPDEALLASAAAGKLRDPGVLEGHARRMLADPRAAYLADSFGSQWLGLERLQQAQLNKERFPTWSEKLRSSMEAETMAFMRDFVMNDQSIMSLIGANHTFVNETMAKHYGIQGPNTDEFVKVALTPERRGILTHASILAMNSGGDHTTPVVRGQWVLDRILCSSPPDPPDDVPSLGDEQNGDQFVSESAIRERLAQHRTQGPTCTACHAAMDPIGLSFEHFDSAGMFRTTYVDGKPVDASGELPTGERLEGATDLAEVLKNDQRFASCFAAKISSFALGKDMATPAYKCASEKLAADSIGQEKTFSDLVVNLVKSPQFLHRKADY